VRVVTHDLRFHVLDRSLLEMRFSLGATDVWRDESEMSESKNLASIWWVESRILCSRLEVVGPARRVRPHVNDVLDGHENDSTYRCSHLRKGDQEELREGHQRHSLRIAWRVRKPRFEEVSSRLVKNCKNRRAKPRRERPERETRRGDYLIRVFDEQGCCSHGV
jgi:hypothetical protein